MAGITGVGTVVSPVATPPAGVALAGSQGPGSIAGSTFGGGSAASVSFSDQSQLLAQQLAQQATTQHGGGGGGHHGRVNNVNVLTSKVAVEDDEPEQLDSGLIALARLMAGKNADSTDKRQQGEGNPDPEAESQD